MDNLKRHAMEFEFELKDESALAIFHFSMTKFLPEGYGVSTLTYSRLKHALKKFPKSKKITISVKDGKLGAQCEKHSFQTGLILIHDKEKNAYLRTPDEEKGYLRIPADKVSDIDFLIDMIETCELKSFNAGKIEKKLLKRLKFSIYHGQDNVVDDIVFCLNGTWRKMPLQDLHCLSPDSGLENYPETTQEDYVHWMLGDSKGFTRTHVNIKETDMDDFMKVRNVIRYDYMLRKALDHYKDALLAAVQSKLGIDKNFKCASTHVLSFTHRGYHWIWEPVLDRWDLDRPSLSYKLIVNCMKMSSTPLPASLYSE